MSHDREEVLQLLQQKIDGDLEASYSRLSEITGYSRRQLIRMTNEIKKAGIESTSVHGNTGRKPAHTASDQEIQYIAEFKTLYPKITITQFREFYLEDVIYSIDPKVIAYVEVHHLRKRSFSFFQSLFKKMGWKSPVKRRHAGYVERHLIREPSPRRGILIQMDGTPYDWFNDGRMYTLHLAVDDATTEVLAGWFMPTECQTGYFHVMNLIFRKYGIPKKLYSDKHSIFRNLKAPEFDTQFAMRMKTLGIQMIFANSSEAKGRIERYNGTCQLRLPNDLLREKLHGHEMDYPELNQWFNDVYIPKLNAKFAFHPKDPISEFVPVPSYIDLNTFFYCSLVRTIDNESMFRVNGRAYIAKDKNGNTLRLRKGTKIEIRTHAFTKISQVFFQGQYFRIQYVGIANRRDTETLINNQKELNDAITLGLEEEALNI